MIVSIISRLKLHLSRLLIKTHFRHRPRHRSSFTRPRRGQINRKYFQSESAFATRDFSRRANETPRRMDIFARARGRHRSAILIYPSKEKSRSVRSPDFSPYRNRTASFYRERRWSLLLLYQVILSRRGAFSPREKPPACFTRSSRVERAEREKCIAG